MADDNIIRGYFPTSNTYSGQAPTGGDGMPPDERVARLEAHMDHVQADLTEIKADLKSVIGSLRDLPTRTNLLSYTLTGIALGLAVMAVVIGGIIGGITYIVTKEGPPQIIVMPTSQAPQVPVKPTTK